MAVIRRTGVVRAALHKPPSAAQVIASGHHFRLWQILLQKSVEAWREA